MATLDIATGAISDETEVPAQRALALEGGELAELRVMEARARLTWFENRRAVLESLGRLPGQQIVGDPGHRPAAPDEIVDPRGVPTGRFESTTVAAQADNADGEEGGDGLESLTKAQLQEIADDEGVITSSAQTKAEIIETIRESRAAAADQVDEG